MITVYVIAGAAAGVSFACAVLVVMMRLLSQARRRQPVARWEEALPLKGRWLRYLLASLALLLGLALLLPAFVLFLCVLLELSSH